MAAKTYDETTIKHLGYRDATRAKAGVYIGATDDTGLFTILREVLDNTVDEALAGHCNTCHAHLDVKGNEYWVYDNGRGMPVGNIKITEVTSNKTITMPAIQAICSLHHAGGKIDTDTKDSAYQTSRGSHGLGQKATNFLSDLFEVFTFNKGKWWTIQFKKGLMSKPLTECNAPKHPATGKPLVKGTLVHFIPDLTIFSAKAFSLKLFDSWATLAAYFTPNFRVSLTDPKGNEKTYHAPGGPQQFVKDRIEKLGCTPLSPDTFFHQTALVDCVIKFTDYDGCDLQAFTNGLANVEGGKHYQAVLAAIHSAIQPYVKKRQEFTLVELRDGIVGLVNAKLSAPKFDSQTKEKLVDDRCGAELKADLTTAFKKFFASNKALAEKICTRCSELKNLRNKFIASKTVLRELKNVAKKGLPAKAASSPNCKPEERELFLLEGDSAAGTCFVGSTVVSTSEGPESLLSLHEKGHTWRGPYLDVLSREVRQGVFTAPFVSKETIELVEVLLDNGITVTCTPDHLFLTSEGTYVRADSLEGKQVMLYDTNQLADSPMVSLITTSLELTDKSLSMKSSTVLAVKHLTLDKPVPVFDVTNLSAKNELEANSNFVADGVFVHNCRDARDARFQEILPLRGKIMNALKAKDEQVLASQEVLFILNMLGYDPKATDPMSKLRVKGKVVFLADPDPDGPLLGSTTLPVLYEDEVQTLSMETLASEEWRNRKYQVVSWGGASFHWADAQDCRVTCHVEKLVTITLENGSKIKCAESHKWPIVVPTHDSRIEYINQFVSLLMTSAGRLKPGDLLYSPGDVSNTYEAIGVQTPQPVKIVSCKTSKVELIPMYCLTVPFDHNFLLSSGVITGNCHINSLLLALFFKYLPEAFHKGMVYIAETPEYYALKKDGTPLYGDTADELKAKIEKLGQKLEIHHVKGYGEFPSDLLAKVAFNPETRRITQIKPVTKADQVEFVKLMGESVEARKELLGV